MAEIVVGVAASHTPQLSSGVEWWENHGERDRSNPRLLGRDGELHTYDELVRTADPKILGELKPETYQAKYERAQRGIETISDRLAEAKPDVALVIGDDQWEMFQAEGVPSFSLYHGERLFDEQQRDLAKLAEGVRAAQWAAHGDDRAWHRTDGRLAEHITATLSANDFDIHFFKEQREDRTLGHAFTFPRYRLGLSPEIPIVPLFINTYFPPNNPNAGRCFRLGQVVRQAIESWDAGVRVAVITSGGLSHFVVNEELDHAVLDGLTKGDLESFASLPRRHMRSGTSEILNWVTAAGVLEKQHATIVDYVPGYRSAAGTGTGMAFAYWK
jgi:catalytic LigB subunit of aromatic ring-opening dioxygenase